MKFLDRLLGKKGEPEASRVATQSTPPDPASHPKLIRVFDKYGRELFIEKEQWRTNVLLGNLKSAWNKPDELYTLIVSALNDGFHADVLDAAEQLHKTDPYPARAACVFGIVLMKNAHLDEAERVLDSHLCKHGEDGSVLTNLAKVYAERNEIQKSEATLWHALEVDPNQDNGLGWYEAIHRERHGEEGGIAALKKIAALPRSWRAQIWLARSALNHSKLDEALACYRESLSRMGAPAPADALMQISGDLGNHGHLQQLIELIEAHFSPTVHGLQVGNNLIKAHLDLGHIDEATNIVEALYALKRPDWQQHQGYWDTEIAKARIAKTVAPAGPISIIMLTGTSPIWLPADSPVSALFLSGKAQAPTVAFLGSSAEKSDAGSAIRQQLADGPGRLSRALPVFLAEQVELKTAASTRTLIPWVQGGGGFVLAGNAWEDAHAVKYASQLDVAVAFTVLVHINTQTDPWLVQLRLLRNSDGKCVGTAAAKVIGQRGPDEQLIVLAEELMGLLNKHGAIELKPAPSLYQLPQAHLFASYILRLEQLLAVRCGTTDDAKRDFLSGEREIMDGNIQLCLACPGNAVPRLLLERTVRYMRQLRPEIVREYAEKINALHKEDPLQEPAQTMIQKLVEEALAQEEIV